MACSEHCSMCSMSVQVQMQVHLQVNVQCVVSTVQYVVCSMLPAKDADLAVTTGKVKLKVYLQKLLLKMNSPIVLF